MKQKKFEKTIDIILNIIIRIKLTIKIKQKKTKTKNCNSRIQLCVLNLHNSYLYI